MGEHENTAEAFAKTASVFERSGWLMRLAPRTKLG